MYLHSYKIEWQKDYLRAEQAIHSVYCGSIKLFHIGSTAVEGLYSKDCIDILGVVEDLSQVKSSVASLESLGFTHKGSYGIVGREYFSKELRKSHFHVFQEGNISIKKHLGFVEIMKSRPDLIQELNSLKLALANKYPLDKDRYQKEKVFFYDAIHKML